tara:strand:+ start:420 stop:1676 length:1257 start_codon:yes stop_codon:yes gene_type:complete
MPKLSIIVTCYNIEPYLVQCLESVIGQTMTDIEIIIVDDGSKDGTPAIIREYAARDSRIKTVLMTTNTIGGVATAANAGLDIATGDYIGFADGDDYCEPTMFEKLYDAAVASDSDLSMCQYLLEDERTSERRPPAEKHRWKDIKDVKHVVLTTEETRVYLQFIAVPWRKIYRRSLLDAHAIRFPVGDFFFEDNPFHWFSLISANAVVLVPEVLCYHRVARVGQTMETADARLFKIFQHHAIIQDWLKKTGHDADFKLNLLTWAVSQLEWISTKTPEDLYPALYDAVLPIVQSYTPAEVAQMLEGSTKGKRAWAMVHALEAQSFKRFEAAITGNPQKASMIQKGLHGLRRNGVKHTGAMTLTYLRDRVNERVTLPNIRRNRVNVKNDDLIFAMTILQHQMEAMEAKIDALLERTSNSDD